MKSYETVHVVREAHDVKKLVNVTCDICKKSYDESLNQNYRFCETIVKMEVGTRYPDSGDSTETTFDICHACFVEKLIPALEELGAKPLIEESDW